MIILDFRLDAIVKCFYYNYILGGLMPGVPCFLNPSAAQSGDNKGD